MAAILATGPGAVLSHRSAAALWRLRQSLRALIDVSVDARRYPHPTIEAHRVRLQPDEVTVHDGIPVTTVARTLLDLAAVVPRHQLERALREAEFRQLADRTPLATLLERYPTRRGTRALRSILESGRVGAGITRSQLEERFLALLDGAGLPRPELNAHVDVGGRLVECDCLWRSDRLIVELDGYAGHGRRTAFEDDRARDRSLAAMGWRVVRLTWRQVHHRGRAVAADLRAMLR